MSSKRKLSYTDFALKTYLERVLEFENQFLTEDWRPRDKDSKERLPKEHNWKPYRFAVQDVILGLTVVRHNRYDNLLDVDVCLMADPPDFPPMSGVRVMMTGLFSEAFKCGGSMEIRFTQKVLHSTVPREIVEFAASLGVELSHAEDGHITPKESREFYLALTGFSQEAKLKIMQLAVEGKLSPERACFMVQNKVWELPEMEAILLGATLPHRVLSGSTPPELGSLYQHDLLNARNAVLGGFLDRKLKQKFRNTPDGIVELESDENDVQILFDPRFNAKVYIAEETFPLPNWQEVFDSFDKGERMQVLVRARNSHDIMFNFSDDLKAAAALSQQEGVNIFFILYPRDFQDLPQDWQDHIRNSLNEMGVFVLVCPENVYGLDTEAEMRMRKSKVIRQ